jgi:hypothetical protein
MSVPAPTEEQRLRATLEAQAAQPTTRPQMLAVGGPAPAIQTQVQDPDKQWGSEQASLAMHLLDTGQVEKIPEALERQAALRVQALRAAGQTEQAAEFEGKWGLFKQALVGEIPELAAWGREASQETGDPGRPLFGFAGPQGQTAAAIRGAGQGALEAATSLPSFADLVPVIGLAARASKGAKAAAEVAPRVARAAETVDLGGSALVAGAGAGEAAQGASEGDIAKMARGAAMAGLGGLGTVTSAKDIGELNAAMKARGAAEATQAADVLAKIRAQAAETAGETAPVRAAETTPAAAATGQSIQQVLPRTKVTQVDEAGQVFEAKFSNDSSVRFDLGKQEITLVSPESVKKHGFEKVTAGDQVVGRHMKLDQGSLIEILKGEGMDTVDTSSFTFTRRAPDRDEGLGPAR